MRRPRLLLPALCLSAALTSPAALGCACGCGVFTVGTGAMFPNRAGTQLSLQTAYMDQSRNWSGTSRAPATGNDDRDIRTTFTTLGLQHVFDRSWGLSVEVPWWQRHFAGIDEQGQAFVSNHGALGDIRVLGTWTGFSPDLSSGLQFGAKLATGDWHYSGFDRDTEIGSGSTDALLGGFHRFDVSADGRWRGFTQALVDVPVSSRGGYRPGAELDAAVGTYRVGWRPADGISVAPMLQALAAWRLSDYGRAADPANTGYQRLLLAPGLELDSTRWRLFADVELPVYQHVRGQQLVAPWQARVQVSYRL